MGDAIKKTKLSLKRRGTCLDLFSDSSSSDSDDSGQAPKGCTKSSDGWSTSRGTEEASKSSGGWSSGIYNNMSSERDRICTDGGWAHKGSTAMSNKSSVVWGTSSDRENASSDGWGTSIHLKQVPDEIAEKSSGGNCEGNNS